MGGFRLGCRSGAAWLSLAKPIRVSLISTQLSHNMDPTWMDSKLAHPITTRKGIHRKSHILRLRACRRSLYCGLFLCVVVAAVFFLLKLALALWCLDNVSMSQFLQSTMLWGVDVVTCGARNLSFGNPVAFTLAPWGTIARSRGLWDQEKGDRRAQAWIHRFGVDFGAAF